MTRTEVTDLLSKAKAANKDHYLKIIQEWKHAWMNQYDNGQSDHDNYFRRAFGIDANMKHSLAKLLMENSVPTEAITRLIEQHLEALEMIEILKTAAGEYSFDGVPKEVWDQYHEFMRKIGEI